MHIIHQHMFSYIHISEPHNLLRFIYDSLCLQTREVVVGCLVLARGIEANPEKKQVNMELPQKRKACVENNRPTHSSEQIHLTISRARPPLVFQTLGTLDIFRWDPEQQTVFEDLKKYKTKLISLSSHEQMLSYSYISQQRQQRSVLF